MNEMRVNNNPQELLVGEVLQSLQLFGTTPESSSGTSVTPPTDLINILANTDLPVLTSPKGGLSLESLMNAIGNATRKQACKDGVDSLTLKADQQKEINDKQLDELKKQLEEMAKQKTLNAFLKAFQIIGLIVGAIASVASTVAGVLTGNPLLIAAGVAGIAMTVDSTVSLASDGKYSLMAGFAELGKAFGMSEKTAQIFALGVQMYLMAAMVVLSLGAAFVNTASAATKLTAEVTQKALTVILQAQKYANIASAVTTTAQGAGTIGSAVIGYKVEQTKVTNKQLEAILERLRQAIDIEKDLVEAEMKRSNDLLAQVSDIVKECNQTQTAILSNTPSMA